MAGTTGPATGRGIVRRADSRVSTETKQAFKTTEFFAYVATVIAILIAAAVINGGDTQGGRDATDEFTAAQAWLYVAIVTLGYLLSRGLAKSGSREPYWAGGTNENRDSDISVER